MILLFMDTLLKKLPLETRLAQTRDGIEQGKTLEQIAAEIGIAVSTARRYAGRIVKAPLRKLEVIQKALPEVDTLEQLSERTGMKTQTLWRYARMHRLTLPKATMFYGWRPEIDSRIANGESLRTIAKHEGISREAVRQYIERSLQYNSWKEKRSQREEEKLEKSVMLGNIFGQVTLLVMIKAENEGWAYGRAMQFMYSRRETKYDFNSILHLFQRYEQATAQGIKLSSLELGEGTTISVAEVNRIVKLVGAEPMYGRLDIHRTPPKTVEAMLRARTVPMTSSDIGYFLDVPDYVVRQRYAKLGNEENRSKYLLSEFRGRKLPYREASQIYEAHDAGFTLEEKMELLDTTEKKIDFALANRDSIEPTIINALQVMFQDRTITKPYISKTYRDATLKVSSH